MDFKIWVYHANLEAYWVYLRFLLVFLKKNVILNQPQESDFRRLPSAAICLKPILEVG